jgi:DNA-binding GntR family transcriptional regulator
MHFPAGIIEAVPGLEVDDDIRVVALIEATGRKIARTVNRLTARPATVEESDLFQLDRAAVVFEHTHGTYGADDEPLEAVVNIKPAAGAVLTFETYEGD